MAFTRFSRLLTRADVDEALGQLLEHGLVGRDALTQPVDVELAHVLAGVVDTQMEPLELCLLYTSDAADDTSEV